MKREDWLAESSQRLGGTEASGEILATANGDGDPRQTSFTGYDSAPLPLYQSQEDDNQQFGTQEERCFRTQNNYTRSYVTALRRKYVADASKALLSLPWIAQKYGSSTVVSGDFSSTPDGRKPQPPRSLLASLGLVGDLENRLTTFASDRDAPLFKTSLEEMQLTGHFSPGDRLSICATAFSTMVRVNGVLHLTANANFGMLDNETVCVDTVLAKDKLLQGEKTKQCVGSHSLAAVLFRNGTIAISGCFRFTKSTAYTLDRLGGFSKKETGEAVEPVFMSFPDRRAVRLYASANSDALFSAWDDGSIMSQGAGLYGQLGRDGTYSHDGSTPAVEDEDFLLRCLHPHPIDLFSDYPGLRLSCRNIKKIDCSLTHAVCMARDPKDGKMHLFTWGSNLKGELCVGLTPCNITHKSQLVTFFDDFDIVDAACGEHCTFVATKQGLFCCGFWEGKCSYEPQQILVDNYTILKVSAGSNFMVAVAKTLAGKLNILAFGSGDGSFRGHRLISDLAGKELTGVHSLVCGKSHCTILGAAVAFESSKDI